jgi:pimeloyl-ACP methyl ester carboxylesterase
VTVDLDRLERHRVLEDPERGFRERFLSPEIGGAPTVAVLSEPRAVRATAGWVICGSFAMDQAYLLSLETALARRLAASGFAVLRYHAQGYGDSELDAEHVTLRSHVRDARDAIGVLRDVAGVGTVGLVGALFGGSVAAIAGEGSEALVLVQPVVRGSAYLRSTIRRSVGTSLADPDASEARGSGVSEEGPVDVEGFPIRPEVVADFDAFDLLEELPPFAGRSLVLQVSRSSEPQPPLRRLADHLAAGAGRSELRVVAHAEALRFGLPRHRRTGGTRKVDVQADLTDQILETIATWCAGAEVRAGASS